MERPDVAQSDLDLELLQADRTGRLVGREVFYHATVDSTMDEARRLAEAGRPEGTVVVAEEQSAGRGRFHRTWVSAPGQDLLLSVLLRPAPTQLRYVNMAATLAVCHAAVELTALTPFIKWPNDVRIEGRKLAGILVETVMNGDELEHAVVGVGINVNSDPSGRPGAGGNATSLLEKSGRRLSRTAVLRAVLDRLDDLYGDVKRGRSLTEEWAGRLDTLGTTVRVESGGHLVEGLASGVDAEGNLIVTRPDGSTATVVGGEVTLDV